MNTKNLILAGAALLLLVGGFLLLSNKTPASEENKVITTSSSPSASPVSSPNVKEEAKITVTKNGFEPKMLKVKLGTTVVWENKSGKMNNVSSDQHPTHTLFPFLNLGNFEDGSSVSAMLDKVGIYTYHNHLDPLQTGTIIVE